MSAEAFTAILSKVFGDLVATTKTWERGATLRLRQSHTAEFKAAIKDYARAYCGHHASRLSVSFPNPFVVVIRSLEKSAEEDRSDRVQPAPASR